MSSHRTRAKSQRYYFEEFVQKEKNPITTNISASGTYKRTFKYINKQRDKRYRKDLHEVIELRGIEKKQGERVKEKKRGNFFRLKTRWPEGEIGGELTGKGGERNSGLAF